MEEDGGRYESPHRGAARGFVLAVLGSALAVALAATVLAILPVSGGEDDAADLTFAPLVFLFTLVTATVIIAAAAIILGLPLTWVLASNGIEEPWSYPLAGFLAGGGPIWLLPLLTDPDSGYLMTYPAALTGGGAGALCGGIWWLTYRRHAVRRGGRHG